MKQKGLVCSLEQSENTTLDLLTAMHFRVYIELKR